MNILVLPTLIYLGLFSDTSITKLHLKSSGVAANTFAIYTPLKSGRVFQRIYQLPNIKIESNEADIIIDLKESSFIIVSVNNESYIPLALKPGDSVSISTTRTENSSGRNIYDISFGGTNAAVHDLYQNRFYPPGKNFYYFSDIAKSVNSYSEYYKNAKHYIDSLTRSLDSLHTSLALNDEVYELYRAEIRGALYREAILKLSKVKPVNFDYNMSMKLNGLKNLMLFQGDAENKILLKTYTGTDLYQYNLMNILKEDDAIEDTVLKNSAMGYYILYPSDIREEAWGSSLYSLERQFPTQSQGDSLDVALFKKYHPLSDYTKLIDFNREAINKKKSMTGTFTIDENRYRSLAEITEKINSRFVFIDLWATWCFPCIQEFAHSDSLFNFLNNRKIPILYLSINRLSEVESWRNFINRNNLPGYHALASNNIQNEITRLLKQKHGTDPLSIPQYILYDRQKNTYITDLPRPSTGKLFESIILKAIM